MYLTTLFYCMDEFSWFVGIFEGEGSYYADNSGRGVIIIQMTDEDIIARAAKFMDTGYSEKKVKKALPHHKKMYHVKGCGGRKRGKYFELMKRMYPYLSKRRQEQLEKVWHYDKK